MRDAKPVLLPQITQIVLFLPGFTGSIPLYYVYFGAAFRHHLPQWGFWAQILWFWPPRVSPGTSEPAKSSLRAESRDLLNINHPKNGLQVPGCLWGGGKREQDGLCMGLGFRRKKTPFSGLPELWWWPWSQTLHPAAPGRNKTPWGGQVNGLPPGTRSRGTGSDTPFPADSAT